MATKITDNHGNSRISCKACEAEGSSNRYYHRLDVHLRKKHDMTVEDYAAAYPGEPLISDYAKARAVAPPKVPTAAATVAQPGEAGTAPKPFKFKSGIELTKRTVLSAEQQRHVPAFDSAWEMGKAEVEKWECLALAIDQRENLLDVGPTGCGKTAGFMQFAAALNQPVLRFNLNGDARAAQFVGAKVVEVDDATGESIVVWRDGILATAMREGYWLILDELDACPPAILFVLQAVLERGGALVIPETGEVIRPHEHFRVLATANTLGRGDDSGLYTGTQVLNEAFLDRFGVVLESSYPEAAAESKIIVSKTGVDKRTADKMVKVATKVREALAKEECYCSFSTRRLIAWGSKAKFIGAAAAAKITILNKLAADDRRFVGDIIQRYFGGEVA